jgi:hypothetical protein
MTYQIRFTFFATVFQKCNAVAPVEMSVWVLYLLGFCQTAIGA